MLFDVQFDPSIDKHVCAYFISILNIYLNNFIFVLSFHSELFNVGKKFIKERREKHYILIIRKENCLIGSR